jgi:hypothetical protein
MDQAVGRSALGELEAYWRELGGARRIPVRTQVEPGRIDAILPQTFILEHVAPGVARLRVVGQMLNTLAGTELRGMPLSALFDVESRPALQGWITRVFKGPSLVELPLRQAAGFLRGMRLGRMLILPLLGAEGAVTRAIGVVHFDAGWTDRHLAIDLKADVRCEEICTSARAPLRVINGGAVIHQPARGGLRLVVSNG